MTKRFEISPKNFCDQEPHNVTEVWTQLKKIYGKNIFN